MAHLCALSLLRCYGLLVAVTSLVVCGVLASAVAAFWCCLLRGRAVSLEMRAGTLDVPRGQITKLKGMVKVLASVALVQTPLGCEPAYR